MNVFIIQATELHERVPVYYWRSQYYRVDFIRTTSLLHQLNCPYYQGFNKVLIRYGSTVFQVIRLVVPCYYSFQIFLQFHPTILGELINNLEIYSISLLF